MKIAFTKVDGRGDYVVEGPNWWIIIDFEVFLVKSGGFLNFLTAVVHNVFFFKHMPCMSVCKFQNRHIFDF